MLFAQEKHEKWMDLGRELLDQQVKFLKAMVANLQDQGLKETDNAKLPMLTITKFDGAFANWLPFRNKFKTEIDATDLAPVTKLKELVEPMVMAHVDGLPLNTVGYEKAQKSSKGTMVKVAKLSTHTFAIFWHSSR